MYLEIKDHDVDDLFSNGLKTIICRKNDKSNGAKFLQFAPF